MRNYRDTSTHRAQTHWDNLGDWGQADTFEAAARALAVRLAREAKLEPGQSVLDVGCGRGAQLAVWAEQFGVSQVLAVEPNLDRVQQARAFVLERGLGDVCTIELGDAGYLSALPASCVDRVLSLDAAYHFDDRMGFFQEALRVLRPGGRLALTDLSIRPNHTVSGGLLRLISPAFDIPRGQLKDNVAYVDELVQLGYSAVRCTPIERDVFPGFVRWALRVWRRPSYLRRPRELARVLLTAAALGTIGRRGLHYLVVTADKPA